MFLRVTPAAMVLIWAAFAFMTIAPNAVTRAAELKMRFVFDGDPPVPAKIDVKLDRSYFADKGLVDESLLVHPENKGIANVIVYVDTRRGSKMVLPPQQPSRDVVLRAQGGRFLPRVILMQTGDAIVFKNEDSVGHNVHFSFLNNGPWGFTNPEGQTVRYVLDRPEPVPIPAQCNIHPWPRAYIVCFDHPYVGVSDEDGDVSIKDLPDDQEFTFRVFHESAGAKKLERVRVNDQVVSWPRHRFNHPMTTGVNDLGTVWLSKDQFDREQK